MLLSFNINANLWARATPITGNVRAVGLPTPACDEWSTMCGENQLAPYRDAQTDQESFYTAINGVGVRVYSFFSFLIWYKAPKGPDYMMGQLT